MLGPDEQERAESELDDAIELLAAEDDAAEAMRWFDPQGPVVGVDDETARRMEQAMRAAEEDALAEENGALGDAAALGLPLGWFDLEADPESLRVRLYPETRLMVSLPDGGALPAEEGVRWFNDEVNRLRSVLERLSGDRRVPSEVRAEVRAALASPAPRREGL